jgi:hypothetical protein
MRKFLTWVFAICLSLSCVIWLFITIGKNAPLPPYVTSLHFDQCHLPCWVGIVPGETSIQEARALVTKAFATPNFQVTENQFGARIIEQSQSLTVDVSFGLALSDQQLFGLTEVQIGQLIIDNVKISFFWSKAAPNVGDLYSLFGSPTDIVWHASDTVMMPSLLYYSHQLVVSTNTPLYSDTCSHQTWTAPIVRLDLYSLLPAREQWQYQPQVWAGFRNCYDLSEQLPQ